MKALISMSIVYFKICLHARFLDDFYAYEEGFTVILSWDM